MKNDRRTGKKKQTKLAIVAMILLAISILTFGVSSIFMVQNRARASVFSQQTEKSKQSKVPNNVQMSGNSFDGQEQDYYGGNVNINGGNIDNGDRKNYIDNNPINSGIVSQGEGAQFGPKGGSQNLGPSGNVGAESNTADINKREKRGADLTKNGADISTCGARIHTENNAKTLNATTSPIMYVNTNIANEDNADGSSDKPFKTLQKLALALKQDTIVRFQQSSAVNISENFTFSPAFHVQFEAGNMFAPQVFNIVSNSSTPIKMVITNCTFRGIGAVSINADMFSVEVTLGENTEIVKLPISDSAGVVVLSSRASTVTGQPNVKVIFDGTKIGGKYLTDNTTDEIQAQQSLGNAAHIFEIGSATGIKDVTCEMRNVTAGYNTQSIVKIMGNSSSNFKLTIENSKFCGSRLDQNTSGGVAYLEYMSDIIVKNCDFIDNIACTSSVLYCAYYKNVLFQSNNLKDNKSIGTFRTKSGTYTIGPVSFDRSSEYYQSDLESFIIDNCIFDNNMQEVNNNSSYGIYFDFTYVTISPIINNCTFTNIFQKNSNEKMCYFNLYNMTSNVSIKLTNLKMTNSKGQIYMSGARNDIYFDNLYVNTSKEVMIYLSGMSGKFFIRNSHLEGFWLFVSGGSSSYQRTGLFENCNFVRSRRGMCIDWYMANKVTVKNCLFDSMGGRVDNTLWNSYRSYIIDLYYYIDSFHIIDCDFVRCESYNTPIYFSYPTQDLLIKNCTFTQVGRGSYTFINIGGSNSIYNKRNYVIEGCVFRENLTTRLISISSSIGAIKINNCTFINNQKLNNSSSGLVSISNCQSCDITNCTFDGNNPGSSGGAIYFSSQNGKFNITGCKFTNNMITSGSGGAIYCYRASKFTIRECIFENNVAYNSGGAICNSQFVYMYIYNSKFINNRCTYSSGSNQGGGAIGQESNNNYYYIYNTIFEHNSSEGHGGAIVGYNTYVRNSSFNNNRTNLTGKYGGAIYSTYYNIDYCSFKNNNGYYGGALSISSNGPIYNSIFENNKAEYSGGSIYGGNPELKNVKFINNSAVSGPQVADSVSLIKNCEIISNGEKENGNDNYIIGGAARIEDTIFSGNKNLLSYRSGTFVNCIISNNHFYNKGMVKNSATFQNCTIYGNSSDDGAVIKVNNGATITISNEDGDEPTNIFNNQGTLYGGAIQVKLGGKLIINGATFGENFVLDKEGDSSHLGIGEMIYVEDGGNAYVKNIQAKNLHSRNGLIYVAQGGSLVLSDSVFKGTQITEQSGKANNGGAVNVEGAASMISVNFLRNNAVNGGAIRVGNGGSVYFLEGSVPNVIIGNTASECGGGCYVDGSLTLRGVKVENNTAKFGGGVFVSGNGSLTIEDGEVDDSLDGSEKALITGNTAKIVDESGGKGGGLYVEGFANIQSGEISANKANLVGCGVYVGENGFVTMNGGKIERNIPLDDSIVNGLGVAVYGQFMLNNGEICNHDNGFAKGGAFFCDGNGELYTHGGRIYKNNTSAGSAIFATGKSKVFLNKISVEANSLLGETTEGQAIVHFEGHEMEIKESSFTNLNTVSTSDQISNYPRKGAVIGGIKGRVVLDTINISYTSTTVDDANPVEIGSIVCASGTVDLLVKNSKFEDNIGHMLITGEGVLNTTIEDCTFSRNSAEYGGALMVDNKAERTTVLLHNSKFTGNHSSKNGGAIMIGPVSAGGSTTQKTYGAKLTFTGFVLIEKNYTDKVESGLPGMGGGVCLNNANPTPNKGRLVLSRDSRVVIKNNYENYDPKEITVAPTAEMIETNIEGKQNNLYVFTKAEIVEGELANGSKIGVTVENPENQLAVISSLSDGYPILGTTTNAFSSDDINFYLKFTITTNEEGENIYSLNLTNHIVDEGFFVTASDIVYKVKYPNIITGDDGKYAVMAGNLNVICNEGEDYMVEFAEYVEEGQGEPNWQVGSSKRYGDIGNYKIMYRVSLISDNTISKSGIINLSIVGNLLYLKQNPTATVIMGGQLKDAHWSGGMVEDMNGNAVAGAWSFDKEEVMPTDENQLINAKFTPYNGGDESLFAGVTLSTKIPVKVEYSTAYYKSNKFYIDNECKQEIVGITTLQKMIDQMMDNGTIILKNKYDVNSDEIVLADKNINIILEKTNNRLEMFEIAEGRTFSLQGGKGKIVLNGQNVERTGYGILNYGKCIFGSGVVFKNFVIKYRANYHAALIDSHTKESQMFFNGCEIYNNIAISTPDSSIITTIILCPGRVTFNLGKFHNNKTYNEGNMSYAFGGVAYSAGITYVNGGEFYNNFAGEGGAFYVGRNGILYLNGGKIYNNVATISGAGIHNASGGKVIINNSTIYGNTINGIVGGISNQGSIIDMNNEILTSANCSLVENPNNYKKVDKIDANDEPILIALMISSTLLFAIAVIMHINNRKKRHFRITK